MSMESAAAVYAELSKELAPKAIKSLKNIKAACDLIVSTQGAMNYSSVAKVATENYGGPKRQSVMNNANLKRYIDARKHYYTQAKKTHKLPAKKGNNLVSKVYPSDNLDVRTKTYIDQLHTRLELAEARYRELRKWQEETTRKNPVRLADAVTKGPSDSGAMQLEYRLGDDELLKNVQLGVQELLNLSNYIGNLEVEERGEKKRLILRRPAGDHVALNPKLFADIERFLEEPTDGE